MKMIATILSWLLLTTSAAVAGTGIPAEVPTEVEFSSREINRVVCPGQLSDMIYSEEKGLTGHFSGSNAFIKFTAEEVAGRLVYREEPSEIYLVCNGAVYTLIATPAEISAVTVRLAPAKTETVEENIGRFANMPLEKQALQVIREAYGGRYPNTYQVVDQAVSVDLCPDLELVREQLVAVEGVGLRLKVFKATSRANTSIDLEEKLFLSTVIGSPILAVAVADHRLQPGQSTRVFVVEKKSVQAEAVNPWDAAFSGGGR
jgi:conjugal transfer pilus assembly protein TraK